MFLWKCQLNESSARRLKADVCILIKDLVSAGMDLKLELHTGKAKGRALNELICKSEIAVLLQQYRSHLWSRSASHLCCMFSWILFFFDRGRGDQVFKPLLMEVFLPPECVEVYLHAVFLKEKAMRMCARWEHEQAIRLLHSWIIHPHFLLVC